MAFPIVALLTAAASDLQSRNAENEAKRRLGDQAVGNIARKRAMDMGASPYGFMYQDYLDGRQNIEQQADQGRNNNIGALLQAYLKDMPKDNGDDIMGQDTDEGFAARRAARASGEFVSNPNMGAGDLYDQTKPWMNDPWGDFGY